MLLLVLLLLLLLLVWSLLNECDMRYS